MIQKVNYYKLNYSRPKWSQERNEMQGKKERKKERKKEEEEEGGEAEEAEKQQQQKQKQQQKYKYNKKEEEDEERGKGRQSRTRAKEAYTAGVYPDFCNMKQLRVLLLTPGWDASPSQGYPQQYVAGTHLSKG